MSKKVVLYLSILLMMFFSGCTKVPDVSFNAQMNRDIKKIAILPPKKSEELQIFYFNHPGMNFGLIGGLAAATEFKTKTSTYNELIKPTGFNADAYFLSRLKYYLENEGYSVSIIPVKREKNEYLKEYPKSDADAYLDLIVGSAGYIAGSPSAAYKPTFQVRARLAKGKEHAIVYDKMIAIGENFALPKEADYIGYDEKATYADFDALKKEAPKSVEVFKKAVDNVAKHIAVSLRK